MARSARTAALVLLLAVAALSGCERKQGRRSPREIWRFAIEETRGSVQDRYAQLFKEHIEQKTRGGVRVVIYPYGALGTSDHLLEQLHTGTIEFAMSSPGHLGKLLPEVQAFLLHFVLGESHAVNACALSDEVVLAKLDALFREKGLRFLAAFSEGFMTWTAHKALRSPRDFEGLRFRVMTSPLLVYAYEAYGARPTPLPYAEVYSALQLRMIDGQVNPLFAIEEMSFHEVTSHLTRANHASFVTTVVSHPAFVERLSPELRATLDETLDALVPLIDETQRSLNAERLDKMRAARPNLRVVTLSAAERARFREAALPVRERYLELAGARGEALLAALEGAVERCAQTLRDE